MKPILVIVLVTLFSMALFLAPGSERQEPRVEQLLGTWVGYEQSGTYFYYLVLEKHGGGGCEVLFADGSADSYRVKEWRVEAGKMLLQVSPATTNSEEIRITVDFFDPLSMDLRLTGPTGEWRRKASLYKEEELNARIQKCRRLHRNVQKGGR